MPGTEADFERFVRETLREPITALPYSAGLGLRELFPQHEWLQQRDDTHFDLRQWAEVHDTDLEGRAGDYQEFLTRWNDADGVFSHKPINVWMQVQWRERSY